MLPEEKTKKVQELDKRRWHVYLLCTLGLPIMILLAMWSYAKGSFHAPTETFVGFCIGIVFTIWLYAAPIKRNRC